MDARAAVSIQCCYDTGCKDDPAYRQLLQRKIADVLALLHLGVWLQQQACVAMRAHKRPACISDHYIDQGSGDQSYAHHHHHKRQYTETAAEGSNSEAAGRATTAAADDSIGRLQLPQHTSAIIRKDFRLCATLQPNDAETASSCMVQALQLEQGIQTVFSALPIEVNLSFVVDGQPVTKEQELRAQCIAPKACIHPKLNIHNSEGEHAVLEFDRNCHVHNYLGCLITHYTAESGGTAGPRMTLYLKSPAVQQQEEEALRVKEEVTGWFTHLCRDTVHRPLRPRSNDRRIYCPKRLLRRALPNAEISDRSSMKVTLFKDGRQVQGVDDSDLVPAWLTEQHGQSIRLRLSPALDGILAGCCVEKLRAKPPNLLQVFFSSSDINQQLLTNMVDQIPAATTTAAVAASSQAPASLARAAAATGLAGCLPLQHPARTWCSGMNLVQHQPLVLWPVWHHSLGTPAQYAAGRLQQIQGAFPQQQTVSRIRPVIFDANNRSKQQAAVAAPQPSKQDETTPLEKMAQSMIASGHVAHTAEFTAAVNMIRTAANRPGTAACARNPSTALAGRPAPVQHQHLEPDGTRAAGLPLPMQLAARQYQPVANSGCIIGRGFTAAVLPNSPVILGSQATGCFAAIAAAVKAPLGAAATVAYPPAVMTKSLSAAAPSPLPAAWLQHKHVNVAVADSSYGSLPQHLHQQSAQGPHAGGNTRVAAETTAMTATPAAPVIVIDIDGDDHEELLTRGVKAEQCVNSHKGSIDLSEHQQVKMEQPEQQLLVQTTNAAPSSTLADPMPRAAFVTAAAVDTGLSRADMTIQKAARPFEAPYSTTAVALDSQASHKATTEAEAATAPCFAVPAAGAAMTAAAEGGLVQAVDYAALTVNLTPHKQWPADTCIRSSVKSPIARSTAVMSIDVAGGMGLMQGSSKQEVIETHTCTPGNVLLQVSQAQTRIKAASAAPATGTTTAVSNAMIFTMPPTGDRAPAADAAVHATATATAPIAAPAAPVTRSTDQYQPATLTSAPLTPAGATAGAATPPPLALAASHLPVGFTLTDCGGDILLAGRQLTDLLDHLHAPDHQVMQLNDHINNLCCQVMRPGDRHHDNQPGVVRFWYNYSQLRLWVRRRNEQQCRGIVLQMLDRHFTSISQQSGTG